MRVSDEELRYTIEVAASPTDEEQRQIIESAEYVARELIAARPAVDALRELCRLKLLKEAAGATPEYERDKPAAWAAAMTAVAAFDEVTR